MYQWTQRRGFTLMELMIVVVILAILSVVAFFSYKRYMRKARTQEAIAVVGEIKIKQAQFLASYGQYISTDSAPSEVFDDGGYYPAQVVGEPQTWAVSPCSMAAPNTPYGNFCQLGVRPTAEVYFQYKTVGWNPNDAQFSGNPPNETIPNGAWTNAGEPRWWYASARVQWGALERYKTYVMDSVLLPQPMIWETTKSNPRAFPTE